MRNSPRITNRANLEQDNYYVSAHEVPGCIFPGPERSAITGRISNRPAKTGLFKVRFRNSGTYAKFGFRENATTPNQKEPSERNFPRARSTRKRYPVLPRPARQKETDDISRTGYPTIQTIGRLRPERDSDIPVNLRFQHRTRNALPASAPPDLHTNDISRHKISIPDLPPQTKKRSDSKTACQTDSRSGATVRSKRKPDFGAKPQNVFFNPNTFDMNTLQKTHAIFRDRSGNAAGNCEPIRTHSEQGPHESIRNDILQRTDISPPTCFQSPRQG